MSVRCNMNVVKRLFSTKKPVVPKICIVGGGPAGFYAAQHLAKKLTTAKIDILEKLPIPFGLVRYGVAPDHPEVKNVINTFTKTALHPNVKFIGNVNLGTAITLRQLKEAYHAVLLTYGAEEDRVLNIPGENLSNVISARSIVGWYNGLPWNADLKLDLSGPTAVIIGQGNVAIDVARILLTPIDKLKTTDITQYALDTLMTSKIREVYLIGRRGPLQAAFTIKELREMLNLPNVHTKWSQEDFVDIPNVIQNLARPKKRITELMLKSLKNDTDTEKGKYFIPKFFRSPLKFTGSDNKVSKITLGINTLIGDDILVKSAVLTEKTEDIDCNLAIRSIGYKSIKVDDDLPFDERKGIAKNTNGRIKDGIYTGGWLSTGPTGVILTTMSNSFDIANSIYKDLTQNIPTEDKPGYDRLMQILKQNNNQIVTWKGWERIDQHEQDMGKKLGKPREKITSIEEMLRIAGEDL